MSAEMWGWMVLAATLISLVVLPALDGEARVFLGQVDAPMCCTATNRLASPTTLENTGWIRPPIVLE